MKTVALKDQNFESRCGKLVRVLHLVVFPQIFSGGIVERLKWWCIVAVK